MSQTLYAKNNSHYDEVEAARWQATQVSTISVMNFLGRILIGKSLNIVPWIIAHSSWNALPLSWVFYPSYLPLTYPASSDILAYFGHPVPDLSRYYL